METRNNYRVPYMAVLPGGFLKRELRERGITQKDFAEKLGMKSSNFNLIINRKAVITETLAKKWKIC